MTTKNQACFLSMEPDEPLGLCIFDDYGVGFVKLREFFDDSIIDLSTEMRRRYAIEFRRFLRELEK